MRRAREARAATLGAISPSIAVSSCDATPESIIIRCNKSSQDKIGWDFRGNSPCAYDTTYRRLLWVIRPSSAVSPWQWRKLAFNYHYHRFLAVFPSFPRPYIPLYQTDLNYRGTSLIRKRTFLGPYRRLMPMVLGGS